MVVSIEDGIVISIKGSLEHRFSVASKYEWCNCSIVSQPK